MAKTHQGKTKRCGINLRRTSINMHRIVVGCLCFMTTPIMGQESDPVSDDTVISEDAAGRKEEILAKNSVEVAPPDSMPSPGVQLVEKVRQSVVLVQVPSGHGTGFVVDGWIVTNHHVIRRAPTDYELGTKVVRIYSGQQKGEEFVPARDPIWAQVYKVDRKKDLALLKLIDAPVGMQQIPSLELADTPPSAGSDAWFVGMPSGGVWWSARKVGVSGHGEYPKDVSLRQLVPRGINLDSATAKRDRADYQYEFKCTVTSLGLNPGDSGGPLVDNVGRVIGVSAAGPGAAMFEKFGYHIHLNELNAFIREKPNTPEYMPPHSVPPFDQLSGTLLSGNPSANLQLFRGEGNLVGVYFDADGRTPFIYDGFDSVAKLSEEDFWKDLDIEWAVTWDDDPTYYFDLDNDGEFDEVYVAAAGSSDPACRYRRDGERWEMKKVDPDFLDRISFDSFPVQDRFKKSRKSLPWRLRR